MTENGAYETDSDPAILQRQEEEVLKSFGTGVHVVSVAIPTDSELPPANYPCDHSYHLAEAYLAANQARLAMNRFNEALSKFEGCSGYDNFWLACKLGLAECHAAIDVREWDRALATTDEILAKFPGEDRASALRARVMVRQGRPVEAYRSAMSALQRNPRNYEAACYLGLVGFDLAKAEKDLDEMQASIQNLQIARKLYPGSPGLPRMIERCKAELTGMKGQAQQ